MEHILAKEGNMLRTIFVLGGKGGEQSLAAQRRSPRKRSLVYCSSLFIDIFVVFSTLTLLIVGGPRRPLMTMLWLGGTVSVPHLIWSSPAGATVPMQWRLYRLLMILAVFASLTESGRLFHSPTALRMRKMVYKLMIVPLF